MNKTGVSGRRHVVHFERPLTIEDMEAIRRRLLDAGVSEVEFTGDNCRIYYPFPELSLDLIFNLLSSPAHALPVKPVKRFPDSVLIFMENNEYGHVTHSGGWRHNVEDVYVNYFESYSFEREKIRRQTWRKYKEG